MLSSERRYTFEGMLERGVDCSPTEVCEGVTTAVTCDGAQTQWGKQASGVPQATGAPACERICFLLSCTPALP